MDELDPKQLEQLRAAREKLHAKPLVSRNPAWRFCQFILLSLIHIFRVCQRVIVGVAVGFLRI